MQSGDRADYDSFVSAARGALADAAFTAAWNEGAAMTLEQAVEHALEDVPAANEERTARDA